MTCTPADHDELRRPESWRAIPLVGIQHFGDVSCQLRNCPQCNSTLAVEIEEEESDGEIDG